MTLFRSFATHGRTLQYALKRNPSFRTSVGIRTTGSEGLAQRSFRSFL